MIRVLKALGILIVVVIILAVLFVGYINWGPPPKYPMQSPDLQIKITPERLAVGEKIVSNFCKSCHLSNGTLSGKVLIDHPKWGLIVTGNLTNHPSSNLMSYTDGELFTFLKTGVKKDGEMAFPMMPRLGVMSDEDLYSLIAFLRSDHPLVEPTSNPLPESQPSFSLKSLMKFEIEPNPIVERETSAPSPGDTLQFGAYLVNGRYNCFQCHSRSNTNINYNQPLLTEGYLGGGSNLMVFGNDMGIRSANITPYRVFGIGGWTFKDFELALTKGVRPDGQALRSPMNQMNMDSTEIKAIWAYLKTVPPLTTQWAYDVRIERN